MDQWPKPKKFKFNSKKLVFNKSKLKKIENFFKKKYKYKYAILMPSGRAGINIILSFLKFDRSKIVNVPKWSSHCLFDSIGAITNVSIKYSRADCVLVVHKWGYSSKYKRKKGQIVIEDSADSLPNKNFKSVENKNDYEIISLPKIIGSYCGGIILSNNKNFFNFCKEKQINNLEFGRRQSKKKFNYEFVTKTNNEWFYNEAFNYSFDGNVVDHINNCLVNFEKNKKIIKTRQNILNRIFKNLSFDKKRIGPCVVFKKKFFEGAKNILQNKHFDFNKKTLNEKFEDCFIFPIHFGINNKDFFKKLYELIKLKDNK